MKKIRKLIYNYVFKRVIAWHEGHIEDQELTDALYSYDIYYEPSMCGRNLKEESHKKEVGQLLIEIAELKAQKAQAEDDCAYWKMNEGNAANAMHETEKYAMQLYKEAQHHKYKRCLAMAEWCRMHDEFMQLESERLGLPQSTLFLEYRRKSMWWNKWRNRWLELAEKFKEAK
jgi:hypothetical protein